MFLALATLGLMKHAPFRATAANMAKITLGLLGKGAI